MNTFWILMEQIELFIVYLVIGVILVRTGVLSDKGLDWIARVVMKLSLPTMIFVNVVSQVDRVALVKSLSIIGLAVTASTLLYGLGVVLTKLFHVEGDRAQIYRAMTMFGNVGFMGIPIITSIFQERGMLYVSVFTIVDQLAMWTVGVKLTSPSGKGKFDPKKLINPATVAIALAIFFRTDRTKASGCLADWIPEYWGNGDTSRDDLSWRCVCLYGYMQICKTDGIIRNCYLQNVDLSGTVLSCPELRPGIGRDPYDHVSDHRDADYVLCGYARQFLRFRWSILLGGVMITTLCGIVTLPVVCRVLLRIAVA